MKRVVEILLHQVRFGFMVQVLFILYSLFFIHHSPVYASTTLYLGPIERTCNDAGVFTGEKRYYPAGSATVVKTTSNQQSTISYLHADHLGSTVLVTDSSGNKIRENLYYPYGTSTNDPGNITDKLYTGQRYDISENLYYYNARYYNPTTGHFISADKAEGPNRFAYVGNNPIMRNDPSGNWEDPYDGQEPQQWRNIYQKYQVVLREENSTKFTEKQLEEIQSTLKTIPSHIYQYETIVKTNKNVRYDFSGGLGATVANIDRNLGGGAGACANLAGAIYVKDNSVWRKIYQKSTTGINTLLHELAHNNYFSWGNRYPSTPENIKDDDKKKATWWWGGVNSTLMSRFNEIRKWEFNENTGQWENPSESWFSKNIYKSYNFNNPTEDFAVLAVKYFDDPKNFEKKYDPELADFFMEFFTNNSE